LHDFQIKCPRCGLQPSICCCELTPEEKIFKDDTKSNYTELAGKLASKNGLANHIWKKLLTLTNSIDAAKASENKAWEEKRLSLVRASKNHVAKYEPIIEQQNKEIERQNVLIKKLQVMIEKQSPITQENTAKKSTGCPGCGSATGCYCT